MLDATVTDELIWSLTLWLVSRRGFSGLLTGASRPRLVAGDVVQEVDVSHDANDHLPVLDVSVTGI